MRFRDVTVEVRDINLTRLGIIRPEDLDFSMEERHNNVGTWKLSLAAEHPLASALRTPGSGIIVTGPNDVLTSGPTVKPEYASTPTDPEGSVSFEGVSDTIVLSDMLAFPDPTNPDAASQTLSHDVRVGPTETVMHAFVNANIGPAGTAARRKANLTMGTNLARGNTVTKSARFPVLGELLGQLAVGANLGFRVVQRGGSLVFETYAVTDRSQEIRLDVHNNTLSGHRVAISPPGATRAVVAGQGELVNRQFLVIDTPTSIAAEAEWGRRIERFIDQRQTNVLAELQQAGDEVMAEEGFTSIAVQAIPMEDSAMRFGIDWGLGDYIGVVVDGQELTSTVTGMVLKASREGFRVGVLLGDSVGFDRDAAISKRVQGTENRVSALERNVELGDYSPTDHNHNGMYLVPTHEGRTDGTKRLYRADGIAGAYNLQHKRSGAYWYLQGYLDDVYHSEVRVGLADLATSATTADFATAATNADHANSADSATTATTATTAGRLTEQCAFRAVASGTGQSFTVTSWQDMVLATEQYDIGGDFASSEFTAPVNGVYHFDAYWNIGGSSTGVRYMHFAVNGAFVKGRVSLAPGTSSGVDLSMGTDMKLVAGDVVKVQCYQSGGSTLSSTVASDANNAFSGHLVMPL